MWEMDQTNFENGTQTQPEQMSASEQSDHAQMKSALDFDLKALDRNQLIEAFVVKVMDDGLLVDIGQKSEGFIPRAEIETHGEPLSKLYKTGDKVSCKVVKTSDDEGNIILSKKRADFELIWDKLSELKDKGEVIETQGRKAVKGGILVDVGVTAFVPRSMIDLNRNTDPAKWVGKLMKVRVIEVEKPTRRVVCSQKEILESERDRRRKEFIDQLQVGEIYEGTVVGLVEFGAFVELGEGVEGLIHLSELTWGSRKTPQEVLKKKQKVNVKVIKKSDDEGRISLSLRQAQPHPWDLVPYKYSVGDVVEGTVTRLLKFGAVIELEEGVSGLLHISQVAHHRVERIDTEIHEGQKVQCKIIDIRVPERKIRLSIKATLPAPERQPRFRRQEQTESEEDQYLREFAREGSDRSVRVMSESDLERENINVLKADYDDLEKELEENN